MARGRPRRRGSRKRTSKQLAPPVTAARRTSKVREERSETSVEEHAIAEAHRLLAKWKVPGYAAVFSPRLTACMGKVDHRTKVVTFSRPLWERATGTQRRETVIHEVAHAIVAHFHGREPGVSHGAQWKAQMREMGIGSPERCHTVNREGLKRKRSDTVAITCCGHGQRVTMTRLARAFAAGGRCKCRDGGTDEIRYATKEDERRHKLFLRHNTGSSGEPVEVMVCGLRQRRRQ